ncbi:ankyrin repeat-containing domain protein [Sphaerosporella brunnea]|uniref:Ankyrin repeat-containing domain protein n=1 Tax=Sphaerosporella brunnea TaxID=1250544 RepID=A0A5J5F490_9PEZI|nr:ankyrin repeat-containing domain protein [Sphaerosporella brunnea]
MSFGFSVGDFITVSSLVWELYSKYSPGMRYAPQEFQLLVKELGTLRLTFQMLEEEANDPESILVVSGEDRVKMVKQTIGNVEETLKALAAFSKKYDKLGDKNRPKWKQIWAKFTWTAEMAEMDALRNKINYHNGILNLLLISAGNSSLQRLQSATKKIDDGVNEIKGFLQRRDSLPTLSNNLPGDTGLIRISMSQRFMKVAEVSQSWSAIGIEDWIHAGRWWLLKSQMELRSTEETIFRQGYLNLMKASWILIDVIVRHPQLNFLHNTLRYDVELLTATIQAELRRLEQRSIPLSSLAVTRDEELRIWETPTKAPAMMPEGQQGSWALEDEHIIHQTSARLVAYDQSWNFLTNYPVQIWYQIYRQKGTLEGFLSQFELPSPQEADRLVVVLEASAELVHRYTRFENEISTLHAFMFLVAFKRRLVSVINHLLDNQLLEAPGKPGYGPAGLLEECLKMATMGEDRDGSLVPVPDSTEYCWFSRHDFNGSLLLWLIKHNHARSAEILLQGTKLEDRPPVTGTLERWLCPYCVVHQGRHAAIELLIENGMDPNDMGETSAREKCHMQLHIGSKGISESTRGSIIDLALLAPNESSANALFSGGYKLANFHDPFSVIKLALERQKLRTLEWILQERHEITREHSVNRWSGLIVPAVQCGYIPVMQWMSEAGLDFRWSGGEALVQAAREGQLGAIEWLHGKGAVDFRWTGGQAVVAAAERGHLGVIRRLLEAGIDIAGAGIGDKAVAQAASRGHLGIVEWLHEAGVDIQKYGPEAIVGAAAGGHLFVIQWLHEAGVDIQKYGPWAFVGAAAAGHLSVIQWLHEAGVDIHKTDHEVIVEAAGGGHLAVIQWLHEVGVDIQKYDSKAIEKAAAGGHLAVIQWLQARVT